MARVWNDRAISAIRRAVERVGLRVICPRCEWIGRHFPRDGRTRDARCAECGHLGLRLLSWTKSHAARWAQVRREAQDQR